MVKEWLLGLCAVALAGCSTSAPDGSPHTAALPETGPGSLAAPAAVAVADPCADGPAGCRQVGTADIDGDGAPDAVGVATQGELTTVRVATAAGVYGYEATHNENLVDPRGVLIGAFPISRARGADLVLHTQLGQGGMDQFVVLGWQGGGLAPVPQPPESWHSGGDNWGFQQSHGQQTWVTCSSGGSITMNHLKAPVAEGMPVPGGGILESDHWSFDNGNWSPQGSENVPKTDFNYQFDSHARTFQCDDQLRR